VVSPRKQAYKHTHARAQWSHASVGLAQARPNNLVCNLSTTLTIIISTGMRKCQAIAVRRNEWILFLSLTPQTAGQPKSMRLIKGYSRAGKGYRVEISTWKRVMYDYSFFFNYPTTFSVAQLSPIVGSEMKKWTASAACITDLLFSVVTSEQCWMWSGISRILH